MAEIFGYTFANAALLDEALTTPSCRMCDPGVADNQRLEFLGDAVLGMLAADALYTSTARVRASEGALTVRRTKMVSTTALCEAAARTDLAARLKRNQHAGPLPANSKTIADAVEAIIGAAYLDGGFDAARGIFEFLSLADRARSDGWEGNPKGELQVRAQAMVPPRHPEYRLLKTEGKAHAPLFTVDVTVEGLGSATACAGSLQEAESRAAAKLLAAIASDNSGKERTR